MNVLDIDKHTYKRNDTMLVTIYPGTYVDSCFGLQIKNLDTGNNIEVKGFSGCEDVLTKIDSPLTRKIFLDERYNVGNYIISVQQAGNKPVEIKFEIIKTDI
jgi:hypothetical protein